MDGGVAARSAGLGMVILSAALAGCPGRSGAPDAVSAGKDAREDAASYARSTAHDTYSAVRRGKVDLTQSLFAEDAFIVGPRPGDVYANRTDAVLAVTGELEAGERQRLRSRGLAPGSSVTGKSAWVVDRIDIARRRYTVVAVLAEIDEIWYVVAVHVGATEPAGGDAAPAPLSGGVDPGAGEAVDLARAGAADPAQLVSQLSDHAKTTVMGPDRNDHLRGKRKIERKWIKKKKKKKKKRKRKRRENDEPEPPADDEPTVELTRHAPAPRALGDVRAGVTPDGGVAWVIANARAGEGDGATPHRMMFVYERVDDAWRLVALQDAVL